jgi:hypothetical protein
MIGRGTDLYESISLSSTSAIAALPGSAATAPLFALPPVPLL